MIVTQGYDDSQRIATSGFGGVPYTPPTPTVGNIIAGPPIPRPIFPIHLLVLIRDWLKTKKEVKTD